MCYLKNVMQQHKFKAKHDQGGFHTGHVYCGPNPSAIVPGVSKQVLD